MDLERKNGAKTPRGRPFAAGNPGRPKGARHKTTVLAERLMSSDLKQIVQSVIDAAVAGDMGAAKIILDRLIPIRKGRPVMFDLPKGLGAAGIAVAFESLVEAVSGGQLTPEEGQSVAVLLDAQRKAVELNEIGQRLQILEARANGSGRQ